jgi:hypothetical protein
MSGEVDGEYDRGDHGDTSVRGARATQGLAISPVPLSLDGKTGKERALIGW